MRMFRHLLKRQFVEDIMTFRFLTSFVLILAAVVALSLVFAGHYASLQEDCSKTAAQNDRYLREFAKSPARNIGSAEQYLMLKPRPELFIAEAYEGDLPRGFFFGPAQHSLQVLNPNEEASSRQLYRTISRKESLVDVLTSTPDLAFIVQFVLSFFALVLAFDAMTSEKERGTLRLVYSNPAKRAYFVLAKYLSALSAMGAALLIGLALSPVLLHVLASVPISSSIITSLVLFFLVAALYLSTFILLGMACSVSSHCSKNSLVLCLLVWVFLVVILPKSTGMFLTLKRYDVPTQEEIRQKAQDARYENGKRLEKELPPEVLANWEKYRLSEKVLRLYAEGDKAEQDVLDFYMRKKLAAVREVRKANILSPASLFEYASASVAGTGLPHFENLWAEAGRYENDFTAFVKNENSLLAKGAFFYLNDETISNKPLDFNAIPKFEDRLPRPGERLKEALPYVALLALYNLLLFGFVFYKFQTYDVR
jgi:ABC-type transport system involved in multi-copper enzyme maturation permease subunit